MVKAAIGVLLGVGAVCIVVVVLVVGVVASLLPALGNGGNGGSGGDACETATAPSGCVAPPTQVAARVVALAREMADALSVNPACGGMISYPNCYYTWYTARFPQEVVAYGQKVCPGCSTWQNGTYQCVSFVRGAYGPLYPMAWGPDAFDFWSVYQGKPGWQEIPAAASPPVLRSEPLPGDVMVFKDSSYGHVAIVMAVLPPKNGQAGSITFAQSNSPAPYTTMPLLPDLSVDTHAWPGYVAWGYIRPAIASTAQGTQATSYRQMAIQDAVNAGIPPAIFVRQIQVESGFNPQALSPAGAVGIAQFVPVTASQLGINPSDPVASLKAAAHLDASYLASYGGDWAKALAAYNWGTERLNADIAVHGGRWLAYAPPETQQYIATILG